MAEQQKRRSSLELIAIAVYSASGCVMLIVALRAVDARPAGYVAVALLVTIAALISLRAHKAKRAKTR